MLMCDVMDLSLPHFLQYLRHSTMRSRQGAESSESLARTTEDAPAAAAAAATTASDCLGEFDCSSSSSSSSSSGSDTEGEDDGEDKKRMKRYHAHELPWKMKIAFNHPYMKGVIVVAAGDMGHGVKKLRNAMDLSGKGG